MTATINSLAQAINETPWWTPPEMWTGKTCYIIGGGPSLEGFDFTPLHGQHVIGCNDAYSLGPWVDVCLFGDWGWWVIHGVDRVVHDGKKRDHDGLLRFPGLIVSNTPPKNMPKIIHTCPRVLPMRRQAEGIPMRRDVLTWYDNCGAAAIHLALLFGATRVVLLGFDMKRGNGRQNWHRAIKPEAPPSRNDHHVMKHARLERAVAASRYKDVKILNANPDSACDAWPKVNWEEVRP